MMGYFSMIAFTVCDKRRKAPALKCNNRKRGKGNNVNLISKTRIDHAAQET